MKRFIFPIILPGAIMALCTMAMAHPHKPDTEDTVDNTPKVERIWPNFGQKTDNEKAVKKIDMADKEAKRDKDIKKKSYSSATGGNDTMDAEEFTQRLERRFERHAKKIDRNLDRAKSKNEFLKSQREIESLEDLGDAAHALEDLLSESGILSGLGDMIIDLADDFEIDSSDEGVSLNFEGKRLGRLKMDKDSQDGVGIEGFGKNMSVNKEVIRKNGKTKTRIVIELDGDEEFDIELTPKN